MDIEFELFKEFKEYMLEKSSYNPKVFNKAPKSLTHFPTIICKENGSIDDLNSKSLNGLEYSDRLTYTIEIYSKDIIMGNTTIPSKIVMSEIKQLVFEFFRQVGFERTAGEYVDYYADYTVDRYFIIEQGTINNWNKKII